MVCHANILDQDNLKLRNAGKISVVSVGNDFQTTSKFISKCMKLIVTCVCFG